MIHDCHVVTLHRCVGLSPAVFCIYYISRGVLQENRQELVVFVLNVLVVMIRSVVNFSVLGSKSKQELLVGHPRHRVWTTVLLKDIIFFLQLKDN